MPRGTPNSETADDFPTTGVDSIKADDPDAQIIGAINGPKSVPGRVSFVLTSESRTLIVIQRASGNFKIYEERKAAPKLDGASGATIAHVGKAVSVA